jgi:hypothetical protein
MVTIRILNLAFQVVGVLGRKAPIDDLAFAARYEGIDRLSPSTGRFSWPHGTFRNHGETDPLDELHLRLVGSAHP